jgi:hypothetical protein
MDSLTAFAVSETAMITYVETCLVNTYYFVIFKVRIRYAVLTARPAPARSEPPPGQCKFAESAIWLLPSVYGVPLGYKKLCHIPRLKWV